MLSDSYLSNLRQRLARWFEQNARPLPWRETNDPYHIWLSEVILQQTQVVQGIGYYHKFLDAYPTIADLAKASEDDVLRLWQGLGYYSRGRNLLKAARMVVEEFGGRMPNTLAEISRLPGVGAYTQAAVLSFAFDLPYAAVDGNVYRVVSRLLDSDVPIDTPAGQKFYREQASMLLDPSAPCRHNQAMIELGALCCTPRKPQCLLCPLSIYCQANASGQQLDRPIKQGKIKVTERHLHYFLVRLGKGDHRTMLIRRRGSGDIWEGLYELPLIETEEPTNCSALISTQAWTDLTRTLHRPTLHPKPIAQLKHRLTHRLLYATLYLIEAERYTPSATDPNPFVSISEDERDLYGMPILLDKMLAKASQ